MYTLARAYERLLHMPAYLCTYRGISTPPVGTPHEKMSDPEQDPELGLQARGPPRLSESRRFFKVQSKLKCVCVEEHGLAPTSPCWTSSSLTRSMRRASRSNCCSSSKLPIVLEREWRGPCLFPSSVKTMKRKLVADEAWLKKLTSALSGKYGVLLSYSWKQGHSAVQSGLLCAF